jgi:hypothetical protein
LANRVDKFIAALDEGDTGTAMALEIIKGWRTVLNWPHENQISRPARRFTLACFSSDS